MWNLINYKKYSQTTRKINKTNSEVKISMNKKRILYKRQKYKPIIKWLFLSRVIIEKGRNGKKIWWGGRGFSNLGYLLVPLYFFFHY